MSTGNILSIISILFLGSCFFSGQEDKDSENKIQPNKRESVKQENIGSDFDGLFLNTWNNSGILIVHDRKIHHFNRQQFESLYKDEEYDYTGVEDGFFLINRTYRLDRNDSVVSQETLLKDIKPIFQDGQLVALERNSRTFVKMNSISELFSRFGWQKDQTVTKYLNSLDLDANYIRVIMSKEDYYLHIGLLNRVLRDGDVSLDDMMRYLLKSG